MTLKITILILKLLFKFITADMMGKIVGGEFSNIKNFPHAAFITINCDHRVTTCGASILNQVILLTAAHCLVRCQNDYTVYAYTGSERKKKGFQTKVSRFKIHEDYDDESKAMDIGLLRLEKELEFGSRVKRVAIMRVPPKHVSAVIAGWGWIDSEGTQSDVLKHANNQEVFRREFCETKLNKLPIGTFCARDFDGVSYPEKGDSGSALLIEGYIQIGIVSFKKRSLSNNTIVYTDVPYFYDWIIKNAEELYCKDNKKNLKRYKKIDRKIKMFDKKVKGKEENGLSYKCKY